MLLGEVIRMYRKKLDITQEEMAVRLGVTAPAVNKWENGNSYPDIMLLAPIARLLGITVDTLLSFHEELTSEEIGEIIYEADAMLKEKPYEEAFQWAKKKLAQYPNCEQLIWQIAVVLHAQLIFQKITNEEEYEEYLCSLFERVLQSNDETLRYRAADSLCGFYMRKRQYGKAEEYLEYFSKQNPQRKIMQAQIYRETNQIQRAYKECEELLFLEYPIISAAIHGIYMLTLQDKDMDKAHMLVKKQEKLAKCFDMGKYHESSCRLEIATMEKDTETVIETMRELLDSVGQIDHFCQSPLYEHMEFKETREEFLTEIKNKLLDNFRDEETFGFLKHDKRWKELVKR